MEKKMVKPNIKLQNNDARRRREVQLSWGLNYQSHGWAPALEGYKAPFES